jgi:hypothetical protein
VRATRAWLLLSLVATASCGGDAPRDPAPAAESSSPVAAWASAAASAAPAAAPEASGAEPAAPPVAPEGAPLVTLGGTSRPLPPLPEGKARIAARAMLVPVQEKASASSKKIGWLRAGAVVALRAPDVAGTDGCPGGFFAIEPAGFVCAGDKATLDTSDPIVRATARRPDHTQKLPYMYGTVTRGGPVYAKVPSEEEVARFEPGLSKHIEKWKKDEESGATYGLDVWAKWSSEPLPPAIEAWDARQDDPATARPFYLRDGGRVPDLSGLAGDGGAVKIDQVDRRQGVAFIDTFLDRGRRWNVATDLRLIPADRLRPIRGSEHRGVLIGIEIDFPFAIIRRPGGEQHRFAGEGKKKKLVAHGPLAYRAAIPLTGKQQFVGDVLHYETRDGLWISDRFASRLDPAKKMPKWAKEGERWIDVNITKQTLVAYEGTRAVFATLVSTGEAGLADHEGSTATKKGIFRIHTKFVTTTMDSDAVGEEFELRDVPYVQYFEEGYALHGAYWHDPFGMPKSHGCINLAPEDARRLFFWTEPQVPERWHGAARALTGTVVFVHP